MRRFIAAALLALAGCGPSSPSVVLHPDDRPPASLRDWGVLFVADGRLQLNDSVTPYELASPLFSDYAQKLRSVWLPPGSNATYVDDGVFDFPVGTIISKTFYYPRGPAPDVVARVDTRGNRAASGLDLAQYRVIETRLLVRYAAGWRALPYVWDADARDATLAVAGDIVPLAFESGENFSYVVPDRNQCAGCHTPDHTAKTLQPIGPRAWQLNVDAVYPERRGNQLQAWVDAGLLDGLPPQPPRAVDWANEAVALGDRARAYLDVNCAHCHNARGAADTSALHLDRAAPLDVHFGICKSPVAVGRGSGNRPWDIAPGDPAASILVYRMEHSDPAIAMPELGRSVVHAEGVELLTRWIASLPGRC